MSAHGNRRGPGGGALGGQGQDPAGGAPHQEGPYLVVVRGEPGAEELAALTAVLTARAARARAQAQEAAQPEAVSGWGERSRGLRGRLGPRPGPGAWRLSLR